MWYFTSVTLAVLFVIWNSEPSLKKYLHIKTTLLNVRSREAVCAAAYVGKKWSVSEETVRKS